MSSSDQSAANTTLLRPPPQLEEYWLFIIMTTAPSCVFLYINSTIIFTLGSKAVFYHTSRYILLQNLLVADTCQIAYSQVMFLIASARVRTTYVPCTAALLLGNFFNGVSPLTLTMMSLERFVAVCDPLRYPTIVTIQTTAQAVAGVWAFSALNVLTRVLLLLRFRALDSVLMVDVCGQQNIFSDPASDLYSKAYFGFLFASGSVVIASTYVGVVLAAKSATTNKSSARKARKTLLLHLVQLVLSLLSAIHHPILFSVHSSLPKATAIRVQILLYLFVIIVPRCLSPLIYGLRDQTVRPVLLQHLCCGWRCSGSERQSQ